MFRTVTSNPLLAVGQGAFISVAQESVESDPKKVVRRYAIINSDTLEVHGKYEGPTARDDFNAAIDQLLQQAAQQTTSIASKVSTLQEMLAAVEPAAPAVEPAVAAEPASPAE